MLPALLTKIVGTVSENIGKKLDVRMESLYNCDEQTPPLKGGTVSCPN
jgi:hypothetical protein